MSVLRELAESALIASPALLRGRRSAPGHCYVITTVTRNRQRLLCEPDVASLLADAMRKTISDDGATSWAWVAMPDHVHWLLQLGGQPLHCVVQSFKSRSAVAINELRRTRGPVWQAGYHDRCIRHERELLTQLHYLIANPLRAGLVTAIEDYPNWWCRWPLRTGDLDAASRGID